MIVKFDDTFLSSAAYDEIVAKQHLVRFFNCRLLRRGKFVDEDLWIERGRVVNPEPIFYSQRRRPFLSIDCCGRMIAPGFIDIQINGYFLINDLLCSYLKIRL